MGDDNSITLVPRYAWRLLRDTDLRVRISVHSIQKTIRRHFINALHEKKSICLDANVVQED